MKRLIDKLKTSDIGYARIFGFLVLGILIIIWYISVPNMKSTIEPMETLCPTPNISNSDTVGLIKVYIVGEINNPGVYEVKVGSIVNEIIVLAGGFTENANLLSINLAYILKENCMIIVGSNDAETETIISSNMLYPLDIEIGTKLININKASLEELCSLPGIGEATANRIIQYRKTKVFSKIEDIMNVSGIGQSKFDAIKDLISIE